jgi:CHASE2 domain-containing sensor protein
VSDQVTSEPPAHAAINPRFRIKTIAALVLSTVTALVLIAASRAGLLPDAQDRVLYDWRSYYLTAPAKGQHQDIALVLIDEDSLDGYPSLSPVDRGLIGELVQKIDEAGAKVIGLDFVIDRPQEASRHQRLVSAVRNTKHAKIVQATLVSGLARPKEFAFQEAYLAESRAIPAHLYFGSERNRLTLGDQAVRYRMPEGMGEPPRPSFAWAIAKAGGYEFREPPSALITWQRPPADSTDLFPVYAVRPHLDEAGHRIRDPLPERALSALKEKMVLIGGAFSDRDRHLTPWTMASGERVPGVEVHAQILAHLIGERWTYEPQWWWELPLLILVGCLGFFAAAHWKLSGSGLVSSAIALATVVVLGIVLYWAFHVMLPSATIILAWPAGLFFGSIADWVIARLWGRPSLAAA